MEEQAKLNRQISNNKKLEQIYKMSDKELVDQLKTKGLESFGTKQERVDRLKKYHGIKEDADWKKKTEVKSSCVKEVETLRKKREERRDTNNQRRHEIQQLKAYNESIGRYGTYSRPLTSRRCRVRVDDQRGPFGPRGCRAAQ